MENLTIDNLGQSGVVIDKVPIRNDTVGNIGAVYGDNTQTELLQAQNAITDPLGVMGGLVNRPGLIHFNAGAAAGPVLGGIGVPLTNLSGGGTHYFFIGRGPVT